MRPVVKTENLTCTLKDGTPILNNVSLEVMPGECVLFCGRSGSGKTTLTKCLNGLIPHFDPGVSRSGKVEVCGKDPATCEAYELALDVGNVFQNPKSQFFNLTSDDELAFGLEVAGVDPDAIDCRVDEVTRALAIENLRRRNVNHMSGGEKQSLVFASVEVAGPSLYVLDEPTANLDREATSKIRSQIEVALSSGKTVIVAEHRLDFIADLITRALLVEKGRVARTMSSDELLSLSTAELERLGLRNPRRGPQRDLRHGSRRDPQRNPQHDPRHDPRRNPQHDPQRNQTSPYASSSAPSRAPSLACSHATSRTPSASATPHARPSEGQDASCLCVRNLTVTRKGQEVFKRVSFEVSPGHVIGIVGANGAGKTTMLRALAGLERHASGSVLLGSVELSRKQRRRTFAYVMQDVNHQLFADSVWAECAMSVPASLDEAPARKRVEDALRRLDLLDKAGVHPMALSGGQKQRLAIASCLLAERPVLLMDEPTSGLDFSHMMDVTQLLRGLAGEGLIVCVATHDGEFMERVCDCIVEIGGGGA